MVNGVFLVALCLSIFLEAIQRLVEPQVVYNPKLVCIVGCCGLASNILGLVLFHDHSHGHGHEHDRGDEEEHVAVGDAERGYGDYQQSDPVVADQHGTAASVMPENLVGRGRPENLPHPSTEPASPRKRRVTDTQIRGVRRYSSSTSRGFEDIHVHPATMRQDIIAASRGEYDSEPSTDSETGREDEAVPSERSNLLRHRDRGSNYTEENGTPSKVPDGPADDDVHKSHNHAQPKPKGQKKGGHDLNMRGVFLHVMGDALGNIGVIISALIIWLTNYPWRFYVDPGISLVITVIILASAIPLCKAASRILLQAVPPGMSIDHIKEDIERLPGVIGSHHLHVWQLSDTKIVASIHIQVDTEIKGEGSERYMHLARQVRKCLHAYGIHSSTIQPEFAPDSDVEDNQNQSQRDGNDDRNSSTKLPSRAASVREAGPEACLLECDENCARTGQCCPKKPT